MRTHFYLLLALAFFPKIFIAQPYVLTANNVHAGIGMGGALFTESAGAHLHASYFEVPAGSHIKAVYSAALWMTALDGGGNLRGAAQRYADSGVDFFDGPVVPVYDSAYDYFYKAVFHVDRIPIEQFRVQPFPISMSAVPGSIREWPGKGNPFISSVYGVDITDPLAPFVDVNHDGIYDPSMGDYPGICGDEAIFFVFNDIRATHGETYCNALGVEVRGLAEEFIGAPGSAIDNTLFISYEIQNKSNQAYHDFKVSLWEDPDLGCFSNDRVGCDTNRNLMFVYNGGYDADCQGLSGYKTIEASHGVKFLNQAMTSFGYFTNGTVEYADPMVCAQYRNMQTSHWRDGTPFTAGGTGYNPSGQATDHLFPGAPSDTYGWSERTVATLQSGDRRMTGTATVDEFQPGSTIHFDLAFITSLDSASDEFSIVDTLARDADIIQSFYDTDYQICRQQLASGLNDESETPQLSLFPNPASTVLHLRCGAKLNGVRFYNMDGALLQLNSAGANAYDISELPAGVYLVEISLPANQLKYKRWCKL